MEGIQRILKIAEIFQITASKEEDGYREISATVDMHMSKYFCQQLASYMISNTEIFFVERKHHDLKYLCMFYFSRLICR